jgi:hypothetical protein
LLRARNRSATAFGTDNVDFVGARDMEQSHLRCSLSTFHTLQRVQSGPARICSARPVRHPPIPVIVPQSCESAVNGIS